MASKRAQQQLFEEMLARHEAAIAEAFRAAIRDLGARADLKAVTEALKRSDIAAAVQALHLDPAAYDAFYNAIGVSYAEGGKSAAALLPTKTPEGVALVIRFGGQNPRAEAWLRQHGGALVTQIIEDQRAAVRQAMLAGMEAGENPRTTALSIVGRISRATGRREGGVLGLTAQQERAARSARQELSSGDAEAMRSYLARRRRDRRFDRSVEKAIREGRAVPAEIAGKAATAYERRLLQLRGEVIARTEALTALNAGQYEALQQAVESGQLQASQVRRVWQSAGDGKVRDTHRGLDGDTAGLTESFVSPSGATLRFPGDPLAPAAERIQCRCWTQPRIDWAANVR